MIDRSVLEGRDFAGGEGVVIISILGSGLDVTVSGCTLSRRRSRH
jgi:hypothetical protein